MPVNIQFNERINVSVQVGDLAWYVPTNTAGVTGNTYSVGDANTSAVLIGEITSITGNTINILNNVTTPFAGFFIMFSKNNKANLNSVLGYYANIKMVNHSREKIELFSVGSEIHQSSK